jgi:hypothetical protein
MRLVRGYGMLSLSLTGFGCRAADAMYNNSVSFKEALERLAEDRGLLMLPKPGKQQNGKQVWLYFIGFTERVLRALLVYATLNY